MASEPEFDPKSKNKKRTVCGMTKHTKEACFQMIGYSEWWEDDHKRNQNQTAKGRSAICREGDEGGDRFVAPAGNHGTAGAEVDGGIPAEAPAAAGCWWATGQAKKEEKKEEKVELKVEEEKASDLSGDSDDEEDDEDSSEEDSPPKANQSKKAPAEKAPAEKVKAANKPVVGKKGQNAARAHFAKFGGIGFGDLSLDPQTLPLLCKRPHLHIHEPPDFRKIKKRPPDAKNSENYPNLVSKNTFTPLRETSAAFHIYDITEKKSKGWIFDCGATDTMTPDKNDFIDYSEDADRSYIRTANGELITVVGSGTIEISPTLRLRNCLYVPTLSQRLMSISHVTKELNCTLLMHPDFCILQDIQTRRILGRGTEKHGLYYVDEIAQHGSAMLAHGSTKQETWLWHRRLGHPSPGYFKLLYPNLSISSDFSCETCVLAKSHRQSFKPTNTRMQSMFSLVHSDVWGPAPFVGGNRFRYFVIFVDDCTRMTWVYFLKHKSEVFDKFASFFQTNPNTIPHHDTNP